MTVSARTKHCQWCSSEFSERRRDSNSQWAAKSFCSLACANAGKFEVTPIADRYWRHVSKTEASECWGWTAATDGHGYGQISNGRGASPKKAHRVSWEIHFGGIPSGMGVLHKCDNPPCSNPEHLFIGTQKDNAMDMSKKGRMNPRSLLNLRPGQTGRHGANQTSSKEPQNGISQ